MKSNTTLWGIFRPNFLILTLVVISLSFTFLPSQNLQWFEIFLVILGALAAHGSVNALNEIVDFYTGLDFKTEKTPFSGGSGTLVKTPGYIYQAWLLTSGSLLILLAIGWYFVQQRGLNLMLLGGAGLLLVLAYTPWITRSTFLSLISAGLGFGPIMMLGSTLALGGSITPGILIASLIVFALVNNLLLLNQIPDAAVDRKFGRRNLIIDYGYQTGLAFYHAQNALAYILLGIGLVAGWLLWGSALGFVGLWLWWKIYRQLKPFSLEAQTLLPALGFNVAHTLLVPLLMATGQGLQRFFLS